MTNLECIAAAIYEAEFVDGFSSLQSGSAEYEMQMNKARAAIREITLQAHARLISSLSPVIYEALARLGNSAPAETAS